MKGILLCTIIFGLVLRRVQCGFFIWPKDTTTAQKSVFPTVSLDLISDTRSVRTENLTDSAGTITSLDLDNDGFYDNSMFCTWKVRVGDGNRIRLEFVTMKIQAARECGFDLLKIYDDNILYGIFCGSYKPPVLTTAGNEVTVEFFSDASVRRQGFKINYTAVEESVCESVEATPMGSIRPPDKDGDRMYDNNADCTWIIFQPEPSMHKLIQIYITDMDIQEYTDFTCINDYLTVKVDGNQLYVTFCGSVQPALWSRRERAITLRFQTDDAITGTGFTVIYAVIDDDEKCGGILLDGAGNIGPPDRDEDGNYDNQLNCVWIMIGPPGSVVEAYVHSFALADDGSELCHSDRLAFYDGNFTNLIHTFCKGNEPKAIILSKTRFLYMQFYSDESRTDVGFSVFYAHKIGHSRLNGKNAEMAGAHVVNMRLNRTASVNRPGAGYFENSDSDDDEEFGRLARSDSVDEQQPPQLPSIQIAPRESYKAGYLYKQGGKNNDQGWKKRWMVFDGQTLRYYPDDKTPISLRIVPVSLMEEVEICKGSSGRQFQFKIKCKNRTFLFGTDDADTRVHWSHVIMEAILKYQKSNDASNGSDQTPTEIKGCAKFNGKKKRYYMALRGGKLYYYYNEKDFEINFPVHELSMETTNVKEVDGKLQLRSPPNQKFILQFDNPEDTLQWKTALEDAIARVLGDDQILEQVRAVPGNEVCADCRAADPEWASINLCVVICKHCAGIHRGMGVDISKVRSLRMDKVFSERNALLKLFERIGNVKANSFWETREGGTVLDSESPMFDRRDYIHQKYKYQAFCDLTYSSSSTEELNTALFEAIKASDLLLTMKVHLSGVDLSCPISTDQGQTAYEMASEMKDEEIAEYLFQNAGSERRQSVQLNGQETVPNDLPIYLDGYLEKAGPNLKGFNKRKCILEKGILKYYKDDTLKGAIFIFDVQDICIVAPFEKRLYCFDLVCNKGGSTRTYRFSAADDYTRDTWIQYLRRAMKDF